MAAGIAAIVLAGGRSSRFGTDKLAVEVAGSPLVQHAIDAARTVADQVVVVGPASAVIPDDVTVVREEPEYAGPFAAVVAGLDALDPSIATVVVLAGDLVDPAPLLPLLLAALDGQDAHGRRAEAAVAVDADAHRQPLLAAYRVGPLMAGTAGVDAYGRAAYALLDGLHVVTVSDDGTHSRDIDTPADLERP